MVKRRHLREEDWPSFFDGSRLEYRFPTVICNATSSFRWALTKRLSYAFNRIKPAVLIDVDRPSTVYEDDTTYPGFSDEVLLNTDIVTCGILQAELLDVVSRYDVIIMDTGYVGIPLLRKCAEHGVWLIDMRLVHYNRTLNGFSAHKLEGILTDHSVPDQRSKATVHQGFGVVGVNSRFAMISATGSKMFTVGNRDHSWSLMEY